MKPWLISSDPLYIYIYIYICVCVCVYKRNKTWKSIFVSNTLTMHCSTMGVGRQSRRVCFGAKPDKGFLDLKSRRTRKWYREANESWRRDPGERVGGWRGERAVGGWRGERGVGGWTREGVGGWRPAEELVAGQEKGELRLDRREANSRSWRGRTEGVAAGQERGEQRGWRGSTEGQSTPDTGTERRGDKIGSSEEESQDVWFQ